MAGFWESVPVPRPMTTEQRPLTFMPSHVDPASCFLASTSTNKRFQILLSKILLQTQGLEFGIPVTALPILTALCLWDLPPGCGTRSFQRRAGRAFPELEVCDVTSAVMPP